MANNGQNAAGQLPQVPGQSLQNVVTAADEDSPRTAQQWILRFSGNQYTLLGASALVRDIAHLLDPILCK